VFVAASDRSAQLSSDSMLNPRLIDPNQELISYSHIDPAELDQIVKVMVGMRRWREAEEQLSLNSRSRMKLNETDMKALRFLVVCQNQGTVVTPGALADHLAISTASITKLLDRLEDAGHIARSPHPTDRRALMITITKSTHEEVRESVGRSHARRFEVVAKLAPAEREVIIRFLNAMSDTTVEPLPPAD
jgi:DNA-binding MarR family transcriptional regulator